MDKYSTLLAAIHALDPFSIHFNLRSVENRNSGPTVWCASCKSLDYGHASECPVTHLRNILSEAKPVPTLSFEIEGAATAGVGLAPLKKEGKCADPLMFPNGQAEKRLGKIIRAAMGECPEPEYIKSPTDNGV